MTSTSSSVPSSTNHDTQPEVKNSQNPDMKTGQRPTAHPEANPCQEPEARPRMSLQEGTSEKSGLKPSVKITIHTLSFIILIYLAADTYLDIASYFDINFKLDFTQAMLSLGLLLGVIYYLVEGMAYAASKLKKWPTLRYTLTVLPYHFVLTGYLWNFGLFVTKVLSENKQDTEYYQALILSFSTFFLLVRIGREVKTLRKVYDDN